MKLHLLYLLVLISSISCSTDNEPSPQPIAESLYFPPINSDIWETTPIQELGWKTENEQVLYDFLEANNTDAFIILSNGKIVIEKYFGDFTASTIHSWNSAAKTLTAYTAGIAQEEGYLSINNPSSNYMGVGWSALTPDQEQQITVRNHLTMTTGLDYTVPENFCTDKECFVYKNEPGTYWYYHQGAYTVLDNIISGAVNQEFKDYFNAKVRDKIGMKGSWIKTGYLNLYFSNARSMAAYFNAMTTTSQDLNKSYGYLWWLNGKSNYKVPGSEELFSGKLIPSGPDDLIAGLGAFDQKLYVIPSKKMVIIRMGDSAEKGELGPTDFDNELWIRINALIN